MNADNQWVFHASDETFQQEVIDRSKDQLVLLDFWAEWCQPCRMLGPILESLAAEYAGRFVLVKADTEQCFQAAQQFNVQGIPAVFALLDGEVVDSFTGLLPEPQLREFVDRLLDRQQLLATRELEESDPAAAETVYREALDKNPNDSEASTGLARALLAQEKREECAAWIEKLSERGFLEPDVERVRSELELGDADGDVEACRAALNENPDALDRKLALGEALAKQQQYEEALEQLLEVVQQDTGDLREQARQRMVDIFRVLPDDSELTRDFRRRLSMALY